MAWSPSKSKGGKGTSVQHQSFPKGSVVALLWGGRSDCPRCLIVGLICGGVSCWFLLLFSLLHCMRKKKVLCIASSKVVDSRKLHRARFCCWVPCFSSPWVDSIANKTGKCLFHCFSYEFRSHSAGFVRILEEFKLFYPNFSLMVFCSFVSDAQLSLFFFWPDSWRSMYENIPEDSRKWCFSQSHEIANSLGGAPCSKNQSKLCILSVIRTCV